MLDWNESAIHFYESLGAVPVDRGTGYRSSGGALAALRSTDRREEWAAEVVEVSAGPLTQPSGCYTIAISRLH